jgi:peptide/nickel transport system permease protein
MSVLRTRASTAAIVGSLIILACAAGALLAPLAAPYDPNLPMGDRWGPPSAEHWLGLDQIGRDMFSRVLYGGRLSIGLPLLATVLAFLVGSVTGFAAATFGGWLDIALSRIADIILSVPILISALIVIAGFGPITTVLVLTIGLLCSASVFQAARSAARNVAALEYIEVARLRGEGPMWVALREIVPNALPPLVAEFGLRFCFAFLFIAALGFLGLGVQPPGTDWGSMVKESALAIPAGVAAPLYPAAAIALLAIGVNLVVGALLAACERPQGKNA